MTPARQLQAAQRQYESMSPPEPDDRDPSDALNAIGNRMAADFDVGELLEDLYGGGYMAGALDRLICKRPAQFGDEALLRTLLRRLRNLESEVESEMQA